MMRQFVSVFIVTFILANAFFAAKAATVYETLESLKYTEYLDMVKAAGMDSQFNDSSVTWTVFAANNTGVNATLAPKHLVVSNITSNATESKDIIEYTLYNHTLLSDDIKTGTTILTAVNGMNLTVVKNTTGIFVNGIMVVTPNITADKSVIYEMDSLLIPPDIKL
ncbi:hypothetical protein GpartN1_g58.t1 [Galdieria partita]|uniref:FAS1 domain-containing protein n=1 Tax=Galdieria partita TaxID=83374 RepID=A0A9C7PQQ4_9RHOD|nr:hypothetical protein GpartN1_g58.t1 [Galdieria partita]